MFLKIMSQIVFIPQLTSYKVQEKKNKEMAWTLFAF